MGRPKLSPSVLQNTLDTYERLNRDTKATAAELGLSVQGLLRRLRYVGPKRPRGRPRKTVRVAEPKPEQTADLESKLWKNYANDRSVTHRNRLVEYYWPGIHKFVDKFCKKKSVCPDDFYAPAAEALLQTVERFEQDRGLRFMTYSLCRIRGALLDTCRDLDSIGRLSRSRQKARLAAEIALGTTHQEAVMQKLGWTEEEYRTSFPPKVYSTETVVGRDETNGNEIHLRDYVAQKDCPKYEDVDRTLKEMLRGCSLQEMVIMYLYYKQDITMRQIGELLHLSESRISQTHSKLCSRLRQKGYEHFMQIVEVA